MESSFLQQASIWGQIFEIAVKRGVLQQLIHRNLLLNDHPVFQLWQSHKNADVSHQLVKAFKITDPNHKEWVETMLRHLLVLGYGLGWTTMRECLHHSQIKQPKLEAIWCPLTLPGQQMQRDEEKEETAKAFQETFNIPGKPDENLVNRGQPARADFILWLSNEFSSHRNTDKDEVIPSKDFKNVFSQPNDLKHKKIENLILCLEFSYNAPIKFADFKNEAPHTEEISRYARYMESRGVFSRVCAEVEGEEFSLSKRLESFLSAFSGQDKPLFKLCQSSSYTERLIHVLRKCKRLEGSCHARAIAVTSNGIESLAAQFWGVESEPDTRAKLMKSLGQAYCKAKHSDDDVPLDLDAEILLVFKKLLGGLPSAFKEQAKSLAEKPPLGQYSHFLFHENVTDFYNPMGEISKDEAIASIEDHNALHEFFGSDPVTQIANFVNQINPNKETIPLRQVHEAAVFVGLSAAQVGKINVLALEGNPGIGKTTAVIKFLKQQSQGFLFFYLSPRVVINRDVTDKLARENEQPTGILTITSNRNLIDAVPEWYKKQVQQNNFPPYSIDSAVVVDGIEKLIRPLGSIFFLTPEQELDIDCNIVGSTRFKRRLNERDYSIESLYSPGVLGTIAKSARKLLEANPQVNQLVMTAAIQGYRTLNDQSTTVNAFNNLFAKKADTKAGKNERSAFAARIPTIVVMVDELAGDGAGAPFVRKVAEWLEQQFIKPFDTNRSPFKIVLILADASLSNEVVLDSFLNSGDRAPDKVLISQSRGEAAFRVTGTHTKIGPKKHPTLHVMTNSYPASKLTIDYSIRLSPIKPGQNSDGREQTIRQAIREKSEEESLTNAYLEIKDGLHKGVEQLIFFAQDKAFLRQLQEKLTTGKEALLKRGEVEVLDQSVSPDQRLKLVKPPRRDEVRVFLMTSSGARGVSFPKTDCIIAAIPRFNIEAALMEIAQLIYRGRGMYTNPETGMEVSGDNKDRRLVMLINDFIIEREDIDAKRLWLRQSSDLLTLLVMLRSTIHTRIKGDAGLNKNRIAFVPVGSVGDEELLRLMSDDLLDLLREAKIFISDSHPQEAKAIVKKAEQLTANIFKHFDLRGQSLEKNAKSYANYQTLQALVKAVSRIQSSLLPSLDSDALEIPDSLTCIGPFWIEDWSDRQTEEIFSFEAWKADIKQNSSRLLGLLKEIAESKKFKFPSKLKRPANELYKLLSREQEGFVIESSTRQALKTKNIVVGLPLDYPHFWNEQSEDDTRQQVLEDPQAWRSALGRSLTPQGLIIPVVPHYRTFPWVAVAGRRIFTQLETVFSDRYFMASSELNLLNTILLEDEADNK
ncbi:helicase-related protein [Nostoc punctiforme]|uniref:Helicase domain protein n=1 Tax=Nostoc punctiforme (strain ATCC 29133 / PCC 73102) TaxID=63737 RepID=B2IX57_NOSP7|nr:helicase-related protein [Nostoc punctiforme]ACC84592.1 helicase domain protein [Nostoc punctiforme PCC 73102]